jgi:phage gp29-like protein
MASIYQSKDHLWRDGYNPLRGLGLPRLVSWLEAGERGQLTDLQWFYYYMERSDPMIYAVMQRRRAALLSVDWDIRVVNGGDSVLAGEQAALLREAYDRIDNFRDAVSFLFSGLFRGYAHLEKHVGASGMIERLEPVEQWFWLRDGMFGSWEYNEHAVSGRLEGVPVEEEDFVIFESPSGAINRLLALLYLRKNLSQKDWDSYLAVYGIPSVFLIGPPNTPTAKEKEYQEIAEALISDGRGYLPNGSDIKFVDGGGARPPFREQVEYLDKQIVIAATGGTLTMLTESGSGTLAGGAHSETFAQIARGDAVTLSGVLQRSIDGPLLEEFFPGEPVMAYFEFSPGTSAESARVVEDVIRLAKAGYRVDAGELAEKTGYAIVNDGGR